tara:strand:- start:89 stop:382 length:294 start_codon:yes stop_codon:yes gene_type:complete
VNIKIIIKLKLNQYIKMTSTFNSLWQAFDSILKDNKAAQLQSTEFENYLHTGGIRYGESWQRTFDIDKLKGRNTKKSLHVYISRNTLGFYELIKYAN